MYLEFLQTFEKQCIQKWLEDGHRECPRSNHDLPHTVYIPNHLIKNMIMNWCKKHQVDVPRTSLTTDEESVSNADRKHLIELLERVSASTVSDQKEAVKELQLLTNRFSSCRAILGEIMGAFSQLLSPLLLEKAYSDPDLHKDLVALVFNISTHESNRSKIITESTSAISFLIASLRSESIDTVSHAAAAVYELSTIDANKHILGESRVLKALIELIQDGHYLALKDAALALLNVCTVIENGERAILEGALFAVMHKIKHRVLIDEMLELLAMFSRHQRGIEEMDEHGMLFCLFDLLREDTTSEQNKEICVAVIHSMCSGDRKIMRKVDGVENGYEMLNQIARTGTSRAKRKASSLVEKLRKPKISPHTA